MKKQPIPVDVHLMVSDPTKYIDEIAEAGASIITFHYESGKDIYQVIERIKKYNVKAGIALRPFTPFSFIVPFIDYLDLVLLMAYSPGTRGQKPIANFEGRIKELRELLIEHNREHIDIAVDGGVSEDKLQIFKSNGANFFIFGTSGLFMPGITLEAQIDNIHEILHIQ